MSITSSPSFSRALESLINCHNLENGSNTPDFILASFLRTALTAFDEAVRRRADWYGRMDVPGQATDDAEAVKRLRLDFEAARQALFNDAIAMEEADGGKSGTYENVPPRIRALAAERDRLREENERLRGQL